MNNVNSVLLYSFTDEGFCIVSGVTLRLPELSSTQVASKFPRSVTLGKKSDLSTSKTLEQTLTWSMKTKVPVERGKTVSDETLLELG